MSADCCCAALIGPRWWRPSSPSWPQAGANIVSPDQHWTEQSGGTFMQRTIFHLQGLTTVRDALERDFGEQVAVRFNMHFGLTEATKPKPAAIIASKDDNCLPDLLWRNRRGELDMTVMLVISTIPTRLMLGNWHIETIQYVENGCGSSSAQQNRGRTICHEETDRRRRRLDSDS
jgi:formyltetrahydrofolate hydrolase